MNQRRWSKSEKWLIFLSCGVCVPGLLLGWIYERQNELPPAPPMVEEVPPANNALDVVVAAVAVAPRMPVNFVIVKRVRRPTGFDDLDLSSFPDQPKPYSPRYNVVFPLNKKAAYLKSSQSALALLALWRNSFSSPLYLPENLYGSKEVTRKQMAGW